MLASAAKSFSRVWLFVTPWTIAYQAPPSMGFSRQDYWSGLPFHKSDTIYTYTTSFLSLSVLPLSHPSKLSQRAKLGTLCYIATSHLLSISHTVVYIFGEGNGTPLQDSCLENPMARGAWWAAVHGVAKSRKRLSDFTFLFTFMHGRRKWQPTSVFLPGESQGWGAW